MIRGIRTGFLPDDVIRQESCFLLEQKGQEKAVLAMPAGYLLILETNSMGKKWYKKVQQYCSRLAPLTIVKNAGFHRAFEVFGV